jgi:hypothetical protein
MAASDSLRMIPLPVRSLAFGSIGAGYAAIGTPIDDSARMMLVQNLTDATVMFSHNGTTDHYPLLPHGAIILDLTTNRTSTTAGFYIGIGTTLYVKYLSSAPTSGSVYVTFFAGDNR